MPTIVTHALAGAAIASAATLPAEVSPRVLGAAAVVAMVPDLDVVAFKLGIPYAHMLGHRGLSHALLTAVLVGLLAGRLVTRDLRARLALIAAAASHGLLDAFTDAGLGVAFFAPFSGTRYFFPWRPVRVSPIALRVVFSARGLETLRSEALLLWLPSFGVLLGAAGFRWWRRRLSRGTAQDAG